MRKVFSLSLLALLPVVAARAADDKWVTIKGKIVWDASKKPAPKQVAIKPTKDEEVCRQGQELQNRRLGCEPQEWRN